MKSALHTISYAGIWHGHSDERQAFLDVEATIEKAAALGFDTIMLMAKRPHASILDMDEDALARIRRRMESCRVGLACIAAYTHFSAGVESPEVPLLEMQIAYVERTARMAKSLGGDLVRIFTAYERDDVPFPAAWRRCVSSLRECADRAREHGVRIGVQNHHGIAVTAEALRDLLDDVGRDNCVACYDPWSPAVRGDEDPVAGVRLLGPRIAHTTLADYRRVARYNYIPALVNYQKMPDFLQAVQIGEGFVPNDAHLAALAEIGYTGAVAYEICSPVRGGGAEANLDSYCRTFLNWFRRAARGARVPATPTRRRPRPPRRG